MNGNASSLTQVEDEVVAPDISDVVEQEDGDWPDGGAVGISYRLVYEQQSFELPCASASVPKYPMLAQVRSQCFLIKMGISKNARKRWILIWALLPSELRCSCLSIKRENGLFGAFYLESLIRDIFRMHCAVIPSESIPPRGGTDGAVVAWTKTGRIQASSFFIRS